MENHFAEQPTSPKVGQVRPSYIIMGWNQFCYCPLGSSIPIEPAPMVMGAPLGGPMTIGAGLVEKKFSKNFFFVFLESTHHDP